MHLFKQIFTDAFRAVVVKPLLKKANLDANAPTSYRPISNLPFIRKILEMIVSVQINSLLKDDISAASTGSGDCGKARNSITVLDQVLNI